MERAPSSYPAVGVIVAIVIVIVGIAVVVAVVGARARRVESKVSSVAPDRPGHRLAILAAQRSDYAIYIGMPPMKPTRWERATVEDGRARVGAEDVALGDIEAFVVAYPNHELVDAVRSGLPLPEGIVGLEPGPRAEATLTPAQWAGGDRFVKVVHGANERAASGKTIYSTTLTNVTKKKIRIVRFGGYRRAADGTWSLSTVTHAFFTADDFKSWYGASDWLAPGESVTDPNNYGGPGSLWAYEGTTEDGEPFIAAAIGP